jgi:hypothetical protein
MGYYERDQATGARTRIITAAEADWAVLNPSANWKALNVVGGESLNINIATYGSNVIRSDGAPVKPSRGTHAVGGGLPFELAPTGQAQLFRHLFGGTVVTTPLGGSPAKYSHVLTASNTLAPGFTAEKGFLEGLSAADYQAWFGCRVNGMNMALNVNQMVSGSFDILARHTVVGGSTSLCSPIVTPTDLTADSFTSVQATVYEGSSLVPLATANAWNFAFGRNLRAGNYVLGSNYVANLKPGRRSVSGSGTFLFDSRTLYNKAIDGTDTAIQIVVSNGVYSYTFDIPNVDFLPSNPAPTITSDGNIEISLGWTAAYAASIGAEIKCTIVSPEATIDT